MVRRSRAHNAGATATAVLPARDIGAPAVLPSRPPDLGTFMAEVRRHLDDLGSVAAVETTTHGEPRVSLGTSRSRRYALVLPASDGPFELWATVDMCDDDGRHRYAQLREREEVLAQALHAPRLAWHSNGEVGWIGLPVALARDVGELDADLARVAAEHLHLLVFTVERICRALDDRADARQRNRRDRGHGGPLTATGPRTRRAVRGSP